MSEPKRGAMNGATPRLHSAHLKCFGSIKGILAAPPKATPSSNKGLIRPYQGKPMVNKPLIRPYFLGGVALGGAARIPMKVSPPTTNGKFTICFVRICKILPKS